MTLYKKFNEINKLHVGLAFLFAISVILSPLGTMNASAATLLQSFVRFDRMKISTATTGTVCFKPATSSASSSIAVTFPTGYTLGAAGTFTVSSTNLAWPTGGTAITGIATATSVSSQTVTFPFTSATLSTSTLYCFNWTNSAAVTTKSTATASNLGSMTLSNTDTASFATATIADDTIVVTASVPQAFSFALSSNSDPLGTLSTSTVTSSGSPITATVNTNAKNGWQVWAKDAYQGLCAPSVGTCTSGSATTQLSTTAAGGSARVLTAGTQDYNTGVTSSQVGGTGTIAVNSIFDGSTTYKGGGLSATALQSLASSNGTANAAVLSLTNNVAINATTAAATDYTDTITVIGAGLF